MGRFFSAKQKERLARKIQGMRADGMQFNEIADKLGLARNTTERWAKMPVPVLPGPIELPAVPTEMGAPVGEGSV